MTDSATRRLSLPRMIAYVCIIVFAAVFIYLLTVRGMRFFKVPTASMDPTIRPSEFLVATTQRAYQRGDIVIVKDPLSPSEYLCKRIVALEGDWVAANGGALSINGSYVSEPYLPEPMAYRMLPYRVKEGQVFVMGDNRNWSIDSHNWNEDPEGVPRVAGVDEASIVGKVQYVYLPIGAARAVHSYPLDNVDGIRATAGN